MAAAMTKVVRGHRAQTVRQYNGINLSLTGCGMSFVQANSRAGDFVGRRAASDQECAVEILQRMPLALVWHGSRREHLSNGRANCAAGG
jgi:hypothetical protein